MLNYFNNDQKNKLKELVGDEVYSKLEDFSKDFKLNGFIPKSRLDEVIAERDSLNTKYSDYETIKNKNTEYETEISKLNGDLKNSKINSAIELGIIKEKGRNIKAISALLDLDKINLNEEGLVEGLEEQLKNIKEANSYMFEVETTPVKTTGTNLSTSKTETSDVSVESFMKFM